MRISELATASGVSIATIKFYLREGLVHAGELTSATQASYDDSHVHRLRLIRVLREVAGLSVDAIREVLEAVDREDQSVHEMLDAASRALGATLATGDRGAEDERVARIIDRQGWIVSENAPGRAHLAAALAALDRLGAPVPVEALDFYADAADRIAATELQFIDPTLGRAAVVEQVVVGTVVYEQILVALRRLADEHHSSLRFG